MNVGGEKYYIMTLIGLTTGLRISDILKLKVKDISRKRCKLIEGKTKKEKIIEWQPQILKVLKQYIKINQLTKNDFVVFSCSNKSKPLTRNQAYGLIREVAFSMGLDNIGAHSLRKTFAKAKYLQSGGNIEAVKAALNHDYISTTLLYLIDDFSQIKL